MWITKCDITLHEPLFFATREIGRLYETGRYLHNYALTYAFGFVHTPFFIETSVPHYEQLQELNQQGIYVTPAQPLKITFQLATFKYGEEQLHVEMKQASKNTPSFGRAKEIAVGSTFRCYILSTTSITAQLPHWIRLGKWMSKAEVQYTQSETQAKPFASFVCPVPLNPLDLAEAHLQTFDVISMPPSSLVANARLQGNAYPLEPFESGALPTQLRYTFS